jgi:transcriptional regulator with XRE-family HTH domain
MTLAAESGLHLNAVGSLERGERSPTLQTLFLLCRALDISVTCLVADIEEKKPKLG